MKKCIAVVCNNYGKSYDGIGSYSKVIYEDSIKNFDVKIYSSDCKTDLNAFGKMSEFGMVKQVRQLAKDIKHGNKYDAIVIEYPFAEWNPLILYSFFSISQIAKKNSIKIITSVHEYGRLNTLRKFVIEYLCSISDAIFVSNQEMGESIKRFCPYYFERAIPTNIYSDNLEFNIAKKKNKYVYFGLVGKTKAFDEMIEGWDRFNKGGDNTLYILSGSKIENIDNHLGIQYFYDCPPKKIIEIMSECAFCVVPIRPFIDEKNATFKTGCLAGCICIGKFDEKYRGLDFVVNMNNYSPEEFEDVFELSKKISDDDLEKRQKMAYEYGKQYAPQNIAKIVEKNVMYVIDKR
ncbi:glycosyltransferase [Butyrivibrio sp. MB2005]|uniref:glycosyltransferase n=1 Tax=Butyrivibrio sp. MB2005 TaxID=1280678 RepID=UPI000421D2EF|nr:glycosyltransferase [Butyrivibrio sp. MB2005]